MLNSNAWNHLNPFFRLIIPVYWSHFLFYTLINHFVWGFFKLFAYLLFAFYYDFAGVSLLSKSNEIFTKYDVIRFPGSLLKLCFESIKCSNTFFFKKERKIAKYNLPLQSHF